LKNTPLLGIAEDPHGFILRQGWAALDFREEDQIHQLRRLWESIEMEIIRVLVSKIDLLLMERRLTLTEVAARAGISRSVASLVMRGKRHPTLAVVMRLLAAMGWSLEQFAPEAFEDGLWEPIRSVR